MPRRLLQLATALSLLLCLATVLLWVRSYWVYERLDLSSKVSESANGTAYGEYGLHSVGGSLSLWVAPYLETQPHVSAQWGKWLYTSGPLAHVPDATTGRLISLLWTFRLRPWGNGLDTRFPDWTLVLLTGVLPMIEIRRWRRQRSWRRENRCTSCGYDLRASPDICPECGTAMH